MPNPDRIIGKLIGIGIMGGGTGLILFAILVFVAVIAVSVALRLILG